MNATKHYFSLFLFLVAILLAGVLSPAKAVDAPPQPPSELEKLYLIYLSGTMPEARDALRLSLVLLEKGSMAEAAPAAHAKWLNYSRLHVLEARAENHDLAEANLLKARYWFLRKLELAGEPTEKAIVMIRGFSGPKCAQIVDQFDREHSNNKGPKYTRRE